MERYVLRIDCEVFTEMGLSSKRILTAAAHDAPNLHDVYQFVTGETSGTIKIRITHINETAHAANQVLEYHCQGEEMLAACTIKEVFEWMNYGIG